MSRIARTMFSFETRHDAMTIVAIVIRKPIANPLIRSESLQWRRNPVPPKADAPKTCEKPQRMTPATSNPVKVPITEDRSAYSKPSETKLWTNAAWNAGSGTNRFSPSFHAPRPSSRTISLTVTGIWTNPRGVPRLTTRPWPTFASTEVARFALMIASVPLRPEPFHVEPSDRTKSPRSRVASKPMTVAVGSNSWLDVSTTAPGSWYRGATRSTVGMLPRFDVRLSYTWAENARRPPSGDATYTISSTASRARKTAARSVQS